MKIVHNPVIGYSEDRGPGVLIDGNDRLRPLHGRDMLEGTADADGKVDFGLYRFTGNPYLSFLRQSIPVHHRP